MTQSNIPVRASGGCLCGAVKYKICGPLRAIVYCHCQQCRRTSGHFVAATATLKENLIVISDQDLNWYQSSTSAKRGFCKICGASLFWSSETDNQVSIMAGTLDQTTGIEAVEHIYVDNAGDYYSICDGLPQRKQGRDEITMPASKTTE